MNKTSGIIIGLLIIIIIILGYLALKPKAPVYLPTDPNQLALNTPTTPPVTPTISPTVPENNHAGWHTVTNTQYGFQIQYPAGYQTQESNNGGFYNETNIYDLSISVPIGYQSGTDFNVGRIDLSVSPSTSMCYSSSGTSTIDMTATKTIGDNVFHYNPAGPLDDSAMGGQRGTDTLFALIHNGQCYRIQETMGYRDLHGFSEPPYPPHYDEAQLNSDLESIIETLVLH